MKVVFCGNPEFALFTLDALIASEQRVQAVVCSPDKARGRGLRTSGLPVKERALAAGIPLLQPESLNHPEFLDTVRGLAPDCLVVVAFRILPRELFALPRFGSFNVHPSLLPRGRGPAPLRWTLIRGERETGVSIIQLTEQIDGGGILAQERTSIAESENYGALHDRLGKLGARMLVDVLSALERGAALPSIEQDSTLATKAPKLRPDDFRINWNASTFEILCRIRAFSPNPGAITCAGEYSIKVLDATADSTIVAAPGDVLQVQEKLWVGTADGAIQLKQLKPAGKKSMAVADYLRGRPKLPARFDLL
ncbi:methionyl-tRNA formyltransferase [candidate division KSB1 bacterium]|nr:methionyl-tRNA formyltransferase [candidate division KSB1 bacterium]